MAEEVTTVEEKQAPRIKLNPQLPLSSQLSKLNTLLTPKEEPKAEEPAKEELAKEAEPAQEPAAPETPPPASEPEDEPEPAKPVDLGPAGKYVYDRLPTLTVRIKDGEGTKIVSYKDTNELPTGFELADGAEIAKFTSDVAAQTGRARDLITEHKQAELNENVRKFEAKEATEVSADLAKLVKAGLIPKFDENDPADHEGVKLANEIYKIFKDTNNAHAQKGDMYRITYEDAADKYFARASRVKPDDSQKGKEQPKTVKKEKTQAQKEREEVAKQTGAPAGGEPTSKKPGYKPGMTMNDINRLVRMGKL